MAGQLNEHNQVTDRKILQGARYKFGFANILYQGEEIGLGPIHTVIIRALGGGALHIGICGSIGGIGSLVQWVGSLVLRKYDSNRKAMNAVLVCGALVAGLIGVFILLALNPAFKMYSLWGYLILGFFLAAISGVLWNIETNWIGDLVPREILGWFTSPKWIVAVLGIFCFMLFFGKAADLSPTMLTYAGMFFIVAASHVLAIFLMLTITDRVPRNANFISAGASHHERLNYKSLPLWCYIVFYLLWSSGRGAMGAFTTAYLIDQYQYSMTKIVFITGIQSVMSIIILRFLGNITDKYGNRIPLLVVSGVVAGSMFLWVASAWWGIVPVIIYQFLNGMAGHTHSMLGINFGLEIFPDKGRAGYFGFSRVIIGGIIMAVSIGSGFFLRGMDHWHYRLWGAELNHYHLFFILCSLISLSCIAPLLVVGKRTVHEG